MEDFFSTYLASHQKMLSNLPLKTIADIVRVFKSALDNDRMIFVFGNGGSAANASHFVTDLGKGSSDKTYKRFRCLSLNDNSSWMTAIGNDYSYDDVFLRQLMNLASKGDVAFVMSVSGSSPNLVKATAWCKSNGVLTIGLVGGKQGELATMCDHVLVVDETHYGRVEDAHMGICHMIAYAFMDLPSLQKRQ
jgi:D-sedoheptulose 7-phosphate isomerase